MTGYTFDEAVGKNPRILKSGEMDSEGYRAMWKAIRSGEWRGEFHNKRKDGELFWEAATICPIRNDGGEVTHYLAVKEDVTEKKKADEALRTSEQFNKLIVNATTDGIFLLSPVGMTLYASLGARGLLEDAGFAPDISYCELWKDDPKAIEVLHEARIGHGGTFQGAFRDSLGRSRWWDISLSPIINSHGGIDRLVAVCRDLTDRKSREAELAQARKLESIGQLAAGIAHEINTPVQYIGDNVRFLQSALQDLTGALATCQLLASMEAPVTAGGASLIDALGRLREASAAADLPYLIGEMPKAIEQVLEGVEHVARIVRAMKEFSHPGSGEKTLIDINRIIDNVITVSRAEWKYAASVTTNFDQNLPMVPCLPGEFNQVILNLIVNAAHTISDVLAPGGEAKGTIAISTTQNGNWAEIRIRDSGAGIPEAIRHRVFDPFFTTKEVGKGTGQGLAIAHDVVVHKHGGTIAFDTQVGVGTTFILRLPLGETDGTAQENPLCRR